MNINIIGIDESLLEEIIEQLGSLSIQRCEPYVQGDQLLFDISLGGKFSIFAVNSDITICKENRKIIINQRQFCRMVLI